MTLEEFTVAFRSLFNWAGRKMPPLKIAPEETEDAAAAAQALYETALDVPWLRFLIKKNNVWVERGFALYMFAAPKYDATMLYVAQQKALAQPAQPRGGFVAREPEPANGATISVL